MAASIHHTKWPIINHMDEQSVNAIKSLKEAFFSTKQQAFNEISQALNAGHEIDLISRRLAPLEAKLKDSKPMAKIKVEQLIVYLMNTYETYQQWYRLFEGSSEVQAVILTLQLETIARFEDTKASIKDGMPGLHAAFSYNYFIDTEKQKKERLNHTKWLVNKHNEEDKQGAPQRFFNRPHRVVTEDYTTAISEKLASRPQPFLYPTPEEEREIAKLPSAYERAGIYNRDVRGMRP